MVSVPASQVLAMVKRLLQFPFAQICIHSVAADMLDALERNGMRADADFEAAARDVVQANDAEAIAAIDRLIAKYGGG